MGKKEILTEIRTDYGEGAYVFATVLILAFATGMKQDILEGKDRFDIEGDVPRAAAVRVARALKALVQDKETTLQYNSAFYTINYLDNEGNMVMFDVEKPGLSDQIYELMEILHTEKPSKLTKGRDGRYVARQHYNESLKSTLRSMYFLKD